MSPLRGDKMPNADSRVTIHMAASLDGFNARNDGRFDWLETIDEFAAGETLDPELVESFLKTIDCYVMGSGTDETALDFENKGFGRSYGDKPTFVLTGRDLPRTRDSVTFRYSIPPVLTAMGYASLRSSTATLPSTWSRSKPTRAACWALVTRCEQMPSSKMRIEATQIPCSPAPAPLFSLCPADGGCHAPK